MTDVPRFFLPASKPETIEEDYAGLARFAQCPLPGPSDRVYSVVFKHDGEVWTATVGEEMRGIRVRTVRSKGTSIERTTKLSDRAMVLAIFPGSPYIVVTNHGLAGDMGSRWANPFLAGQPESVTLFAL